MVYLYLVLYVMIITVCLYFGYKKLPYLAYYQYDTLKPVVFLSVFLQVYDFPQWQKHRDPNRLLDRLLTIPQSHVLQNVSGLRELQFEI